ncbi:MAG: DUF4397 domain-containing protein [Chloroflexi bacterium]|nr:DUF4397 domain-containing protein [Chloroflexota bacterium]
MDFPATLSRASSDVANQAPQDVLVDVDVLYTTDMRIILDSQAGGPTMTLISPNAVSYGHDNLPQGITYTEQSTYVPGPGLSPAADQGMGQLRVGHAVNGEGAMDALLNGNLAFSSLNFADTSAYQNFAPGVYTVTFVAAGTTSPVLAEITVNLGVGLDYTVLAVGTPGAIQPWAIQDNNAPREENSSAYLRLVNTADGAPNISLKERLGQEIFNDVPYPGLGDYTELYPKRFNFDLQNAETGRILFDMPKVTLEDGALYTLFVYNTANGVIAKLEQDAAPTARLNVAYALGQLHNLSLSVDGRVISDSLSAGQTTNPIYLAAGSHNVQVSQGGSTLLTQTVFVSGTNNYALTLFEDGGTLDTSWSLNNYTPGFKQAGLRLNHQAPGAPAVDVVLLHPTTGLNLPVASSISYSQTSESLDVEGLALPYTVTVREAGTLTMLLTLNNVFLKPGSNVTLHLVEQSGATALGYSLDNQLAFKTLGMYQMAQAQPGKWQVNLHGDIAGAANYELSVEGKKPIPDVQDVHVDTGATPPVLQWRLNSPQPETAVSIYYQTEPITQMVTITNTDGSTQTVPTQVFDGQTVTGTLQAPLNPAWTEGGSEPYYEPSWTDGTLHSYTLPQGLLLSGTYYVYLEVDDGANTLIRAVAPEPITVVHPWPDNWLAGLILNPTDYRQAVATWDEFPNPDVGSYALVYQSSETTQTFRGVTSFIPEATLHNLNPGQTYTFTVEAWDHAGNRVSVSEAESVTIAGAEFNLTAAPAPLQVIAGQTISTAVTLNTSLDPYPEPIGLYPGARSDGLGLDLASNLVTPTLAGITVPVTITTGASMSAGVYTATILGQGNGIKQTTELQVQVLAPTFELNATQNQPTLGDKEAVVVSITADRLYGHTTPIWLEAVDSPSPLTTFDEQRLEIGQSRTLTITDVPFLDGGDYTYQIVGTDGVNRIVLTQTLTVFKPVYDLALSQTVVTATVGLTNTFHITIDANLGYGWDWPVTLLLDPQFAPPRGRFGFNQSAEGLDEYVVLAESEQVQVLIETLPKTPQGIYILPIIAESNGRQKELEVWLNVAELVVQPSANSIYLPLILKSSSSSPLPIVTAPDLVVGQIIAASGNITVVVQNQGNAPVTDEFWVDAYINPDPPPTAVNQSWDTLGAEGLTWAIDTSVLPIQPGQTLTLIIGDVYYWPDLSSVTLPLSEGTPVYAQVDSMNAYETYGAVLESHEIAGEAYNNISGPVFSMKDGE